jgi:hypothetical protein
LGDFGSGFGNFSGNFAQKRVLKAQKIHSFLFLYPIKKSFSTTPAFGHPFFKKGNLSLPISYYHFCNPTCIAPPDACNASLQAAATM